MVKLLRYGESYMTDINVKRKLYIISVIIFIYIFILSTGYAFFSKSLTVSGVASTVEYYEGEKLPVIATIRDTKSNRYYTASSSKSFIDFILKVGKGILIHLILIKKPEWLQEVRQLLMLLHLLIQQF